MKLEQQLEHLPETAARQLGGLQADARLLAGIRTRARGKQAARRPGLRLVAVCAAAALCLGVGIGALVRGMPLPEVVAPVPSAGILESRSAGDDAPGAFPGSSQGELPGGSIAISSNAGTQSMSSLFAPEENGNFPLLMVDGKTYRLLTAPQSLDSALVGDVLGPVGEFTLEPALSGGEGVVSNRVTPGATVYGVSGLPSLVCAELDGQTRVFQRVSFAGTATVGGESLQDTLAPVEQVVALELSGVGAITDAQTAQRLLGVLYQNASFSGKSANLAATQSLVLRLQNGLSLQLLVSEDAVSACGTWSCPEFFEAFALAISEG